MTADIPQSKPPTKGTEGIFLIDKPSGISSHGIVNKMRNITYINKVGHTGTLDPLASGLLIILVGKRFTKLQDSFLKKDKTYICTARLGISTDTYDVTGQQTSEAKWDKLKNIDSVLMEKVLKKFRGETIQVVPAFSAVKIKGQKLYDKAINKTIKKKDLPEKKVSISKLILTQLRKDVLTKKVYFSLEIESGSGTYIRSLIHDIGEKLGVGATVASLRRTKIDNYLVEDAHQIFDPKTFSYDQQYSATSSRK